MPSNKPLRRLQDIVDNAQAIQRYIAGMDLAAFEEDARTKGAAAIRPSAFLLVSFMASFLASRARPRLTAQSIRFHTSPETDPVIGSTEPDFRCRQPHFTGQALALSEVFVHNLCIWRRLTASRFPKRC